MLEFQALFTNEAQHLTAVALPSTLAAHRLECCRSCPFDFSRSPPRTPARTDTVISRQTQDKAGPTGNT